MPAGVDGVRRSRFVVVRNTYRSLQDTTWRSFMDWLGGLGKWKEVEKTFYLRLGDISCEVLFRALDTPQDVQKLLSLEVTDAYFNEAREIHPAIIEGMTSRVGRYPKKASVVEFWYGIWMDTNPPVMGSWLYKQMEKVDGENGWAVFQQPGGRTAMAENIENLPLDYYTTMGRSEEFVRVFIDSNYGMALDGRPVFERSFRYDFHVAKQALKPIKSSSMPVIIGMDLGLTPAAIILQEDALGRVNALDEIAMFDMGLVKFIQAHLKPLMNGKYAGHPILVVVDPAARQRSQLTEQTAFDIFRQYGIQAVPAATNKLGLRLAAVEARLLRQVDGGPGLLIDPSCKLLIEAFRGGYKYKLRVSGEVETVSDAPEKNKHSHISDAFQYGMLYFEKQLGPYGTMAARRPVQKVSAVGWT